MATTSPRQVQSPNVVILKLSIKNNSSGLLLQKETSNIELDKTALEYVIIDQTSAQNDVNLKTIDFYSISFIEDMNEPFMSGSLILCDMNNVFDQLAITTSSIIEIQLEFYDTQRTGNNSESFTTTNIKKYFTIISITNLDDPTSQDISRGSGSPNYLNIKFTSKEAINFNQNILALNRPNRAIPTTFLGPISVENIEPFTQRTGTVVSGNGDGTKESNPNIIIEKQVIPELDEQGEPKKDAEGNPIVKSILDEFENETFKIKTEWSLSKHSSFFNELISGFNTDKDSTNLKYKRNFYSHATENEIWLKPEYFFYPSYRPSEIPSVTQLINYIKSYAVLKETEEKNKGKYVDFMFWEDFRGFHFKSIKKMVDDQKKEKERTYYTPDPNPNNIEAIVSTRVICDIESADNLVNGSLTSEYIRIKPNWKSPFRNAITTSEQFTKELIKYDYQTDITQPIISNAIWGESPTVSPFNKNEISYTNAIGDFNSTNFRISDNIYGFYDETTHNAKKTKIWDFWDSNIMGFTYNFGIIDFDRDGLGLKYKLDEEPAVRTEKEFWQSQFDFCELSAGPLFIINQIKKVIKQNKDKYVNAKTINEKWKFYLENVCCERKIPSNFFALLVDAKKIYGGDGTTFAADAGGIYAYDWVEVEFWPRENSQYLLDQGEEIIKFTEYESFPFVFVKPKGALQGHGSVYRKYDPKKDPQNPNRPKDTVYSTKDTRAYNLSELLNSSGITMSSEEMQGLPEDLKTAIKECKVLLTSPGLSSPKDRTKTECKTSYPSGFSMLPAGAFKYQGNCSSEDETFKMPLFFGKIVQMNVIPREIMQTIVKGEQGLTGITQTDSDRTSLTIDEVPFKKQTIQEKQENENKIPYLFLFDSVNAHDGLCDNTCTI